MTRAPNRSKRATGFYLVGLLLVLAASIAALLATPVVLAPTIMIFDTPQAANNPIAIGFALCIACMPVVGLAGLILAPVTIWQFSKTSFLVLSIGLCVWLLTTLIMAYTLFFACSGSFVC